MGIMLIDSVPPPIATSARPAATESTANEMACNPEEQKRLMVMAETSTGRPARNDAMRATFIHCSASGVAQPMITSSISFLSSWGMRSSAPLMATAARSSGLVARSVPLPDFPTAVRTELAITTSLIKTPGYSPSALSFWLIAFKLCGAQAPRLRLSYYCGVGLGVAAPAGADCCGEAAGVALGVGELTGVAVFSGVAVATGAAVGLAFGCMFMANLSFSLPSGPNKTMIS